MNVYYYFLRILYSFTYKYINILQILSESKLHLLQNLYLDIFTNLLNAMINQETRPIEISQISHIAPPSSPLSPSPAKKRKERERESTNWRRCAVNVLNDGILITRHVMGAIKQLAAVSISPMHQETSARRDEFACRDATFVETIYRGGHRLANFPR